MPSSKSRLSPSSPKSSTKERTYLFKVWIISYIWFSPARTGWYAHPLVTERDFAFTLNEMGSHLDVLKKGVTWSDLAFRITLAVVGESRMWMSSQKALAAIWRAVMVTWTTVMPVTLWEMVRSKIQCFEGRARTISWMTRCDMREKEEPRIIFLSLNNQKDGLSLTETEQVSCLLDKVKMFISYPSENFEETNRYTVFEFWREIQSGHLTI